MPPLRIRSIQPAVERRRGEVENARAAQARIFQVYGRVSFTGSGELSYEGKFPIWFTEVPQITFGGELDPTVTLVAGQWPTLSLFVFKWTTREKNHHTYYIGAQFIIVVGGPSTMGGIAHWQLEGVGLKNPLVPQ